jgi:hypothetical protein
MISWHKPGQRVVCVEPLDEQIKALLAHHGISYPVLDGRYTVRDVVAPCPCNLTPETGFILVEVDNRGLHLGFCPLCKIQEPNWRTGRFRPLYEQQVDDLMRLPSPEKKTLEEVE